MSGNQTTVHVSEDGAWLCPTCGGELAQRVSFMTTAAAVRTFDDKGRVVTDDPNMLTVDADCWKGHRWQVKSNSDGVTAETRSLMR